MATPEGSPPHNIVDMAQVRLIKINDASDGNASHTGDPQKHRRSDLTNYLEKLGTLWMKKRGEAETGITYRLNKLPAGYSVWERPRPGNPSHVDKWCFGHPSGKTFNSPVQFFPHFLSLMEDGNADVCVCALCDTKRKSSQKKTISGLGVQRNPQQIAGLPSRPLGRPPGRPLGKPPGRPANALPAPSETPDTGDEGGFTAKGRKWVQGCTDEEGTPDPYRNNIDRLKRSGSLDTIIEEKMSADWRAEKASGVDLYFKTLKQKPAWQPRRLEIVLYVRAIQPGEALVFDESSKRFMIRTADTSATTMKEPLWEAGIVSQTALEPKPGISYSVTSDGYRVEPISNANDKNGKGIWKQYTYVRADQMRPFSLWKNFLSGLDSSTWHSTIRNAMLVMSTITLVKRYRFKGKWPEAKIYCRGMYLGSELILEGDFVYLMPESEYDGGVTDIMRIDAITLDLWSLDKASSDDYDDGHPYNSTARITGRVFTISEGRAFDNEPIELTSIAPQTRLDWLGPWYTRTPADKLTRVPFHRIMGRCHDPDIVEQWLNGNLPGQDVVTKPGPGLSGVVDGRAYSSAEYRKINEDRSWFWADTRAEALDLEEVSGLLVTNQDPGRDPKKYRKEIRVIEGTARPEERLALQQAERRASSRGANAMVASALEIDTEIEESNEASRQRKGSRSALGKRDSEDDDDDDDEQQEEEDEVTARNQFVNQIAEGLAMSDEEISSCSDEAAGSPEVPRTQYGTPQSVPVVMIDD